MAGVHSKIMMVVVALAWPALGFVGQLRAQDVTVTPLEWVDPKNEADQLPKPENALDVYFPRDLRNTPKVRMPRLLPVPPATRH